MPALQRTKVCGGTFGCQLARKMPNQIVKRDASAVMSRLDVHLKNLRCERWNTMNTNLKKLLLALAAAALFVPTTAFGQKSVGGVTGGARLHPGAWTQSGSPSRSMYRGSAPMIVRSESAGDSLAQGPTERRSYSYEPSQQSQGGAGRCSESVATEKAPSQAERSTESRRSYSYEPSTRSREVSGQSYSGPRMQSSRSSRTPLYELQKTNPRKFRSH